MMMWVAVAVVLALFCSTAVVMAEQPVVLKPIVVFVEGDSSVIPKFINICREMGPERGIDFHFVDKLSDKYDYRVVLSAEGSGMWNYAQGNIVILNREAKVLFTVTRSNRWTAKGATSALTKEFVKVLARYLGTHQ
jgi:hypothetical protein